MGVNLPMVYSVIISYSHQGLIEIDRFNDNIIISKLSLLKLMYLLNESLKKENKIDKWIIDKEKKIPPLSERFRNVEILHIK